MSNPILHAKDPSCIIDCKEVLVDPWGDCHAIAALLDQLKAPVRCGPSGWVSAAKSMGDSPAEMAMEEIRNGHSLGAYLDHRKVTWWQTRRLSPEQVLDQMIKHTSLCGGDPIHRKVWIKRWLERREYSKPELLARKTGVTLVNLDTDPRQEKKDWIIRSIEEDPEKKIIAFGMRRNKGFRRRMAYSAICNEEPVGKSMPGKERPPLQLWSNHAFPHQPYLIEV